MIGIDTIFRQNMNMATKGKSSVSTLQYVMGIDTIFRQNMKWRNDDDEMAEDRYRTARGSRSKTEHSQVAHVS